jgi:hypothetical protein
MIQAYDKMVMGNLKGQNKTATSSFLSTTIGGRSKDEIFDNFISELFTSKMDLSNSLMKNVKNNESLVNGTLPLDQSLLISTAKKQNMRILL